VLQPESHPSCRKFSLRAVVLHLNQIPVNLHNQSSNEAAVDLYARPSFLLLIPYLNGHPQKSPIGAPQLPAPAKDAALQARARCQN
jgi:hypothetical protein